MKQAQRSVLAVPGMAEDRVGSGGSEGKWAGPGVGPLQTHKGLGQQATDHGGWRGREPRASPTMPLDGPSYLCYFYFLCFGLYKKPITKNIKR